jgi:hypothetical protein
VKKVDKKKKIKRKKKKKKTDYPGFGWPNGQQRKYGYSAVGKSPKRANNMGYYYDYHYYYYCCG